MVMSCLLCLVFVALTGDGVCVIEFHGWRSAVSRPQHQCVLNAMRSRRSDGDPFYAELDKIAWCRLIAQPVQFQERFKIIGVIHKSYRIIIRYDMGCVSNPLDQLTQPLLPRMRVYLRGGDALMAQQRLDVDAETGSGYFSPPSLVFLGRPCDAILASQPTMASMSS